MSNTTLINIKNKPNAKEVCIEINTSFQQYIQKIIKKDHHFLLKRILSIMVHGLVTDLL